MNNIDLTEMITDPLKKKDRFTHKPAFFIHDLYLTEEIKSNEEYTEWFELVRNASPNDVIKIHINCYGGDLFTAIQFNRVIQECPATIVASVEGACMSAATIIFMASNSFEVSDHSMFMFHNYSSILGGKGGEMYDRLLHERAWSEKMLNDFYKDFLTVKEINSILEGKDIWMDGDEVVKRLEKKYKKLKRETKVKVDES